MKPTAFWDRIKRNKNLNYIGILQIIILGFLVLNCHAHTISIIFGLKIFLYQFVAWFLVGYVLLRIIRINVSSLTEVIALSYGIGGIVSLLVYFALVVPAAKILLPYFTIAEAIGALIYIYKKKVDIEEYETDHFGIIFCLIVLFVYFSFAVLSVSLVNTFPNETGGGGYDVDWGYWAGNNIGFTKKAFPIDCFRQIGSHFAYHFFSSILMAQSSLCTVVDINYISFYFSSVFGGVFLVFSAYYFATRLLKEKWSIIIFALASLFTNGHYVSATSHTLICPFGYDWGYSYGMISLGLLIEIVVNDRFKDAFPLSCIFLAMTTGCKGPIASLVLVAYGVVAFSFFLRKDIKKGVLSGFLWLASFYAIYYIFIAHHDGYKTLENRANYIGAMDLDTIVTTAPYISKIYQELIDAYGIVNDWLLVKLYSIWLYMYRADKAITVLIVIALIRIMYDIIKKKTNVVVISFFIASIIGLGLAVYMNMNGGSQMYFVMGMYPMAAMAGIDSLEKWKNELTDYKKMSYFTYQCAIVLLLLTLGISVDSYAENLIPIVRDGVSIARGKYTYENYRYPYVDSLDYEAYVWLRDNTSEDAVFAIDSFINIYGQEVPLMAGVFSERYVWNEQKYAREEEATRRADILAGIYADIDGTISILKDEGVEYLLMRIIDGKTEYGSLTGDIHEVFRNAHYIIYEL